MASALRPSTDLTFEPAPLAPTTIPPREPDSAVYERPRGVVVELGATWRDGDASLLLDGLSRATRTQIPFTLEHRGAGGMSLVRAAVAENRVLDAREVLRSEGAAVPVEPPGWRHRPLTPGVAGRLSGAGVVITGGLGGIGLCLAERFLRGGARVWLVDRRAVSELPVATRHRLAGMAGRGRLHVTHHDLTASGAGALPSPPFPLDHLVHGVGELALCPVAELDPSDLDRAAPAKSRTLRRAVTAWHRDGLRSAVVIGSCESRGPHQRFGGYALANELVRREADRLREEHPSVRVVCAEWSLWSDVGMAARASAAAGRTGFATVTPAWGAAATEALLTAPTDPPGHLVLGGGDATPEQPVRVVAGIGGSSHSSRAADVDRLVRLCRPEPSAGWRHTGRSDRVVRAVSTGHQVATWSTPASSWDVGSW